MNTMSISARVVLNAIAVLCFCMFGSIAFAEDKVTPEEARAIAKEAYIFNYSMVLMYRTMYLQAIDKQSPSFSGGFGKWLHLGMSSPEDTDIVSPNNDTPYSYAWVDTRAEPWVMTLPKIEDKRFYTNQWDDLWGFVLGNPGSDEDGNGGVSVLLASPGWDGDLPKGVDRVIRGETDFLGTLTRTQAFDADDMPNVQAIQKQYKLEPLSAYLGTDAPAAAPAVNWMDWTEGDEKTPKFWEYAAFLLPYTTPNKMDEKILADMAKIGLERGKPFDPARLDQDMQDALAGGMQDALASLAKQATTFDDPSLFFKSRADMKTDYNNRALGVFVGLFGNVKAVSIYFAEPKDADGEFFDGSKGSYDIHFTKDQIPDVKNFWSWTMYKLPQRWLVANPIKRYSIGSATPGLVYADDGSVTIHVSAKSPGKDKESNWLPAPDGPFWLVLRTYGPGKSIVDKSWKMPPIPRVK